MKLTGLLKNRVDAAETNAEKKAIIAQAGIELTDSELEHVAGGRSPISRPGTKPKPTTPGQGSGSGNSES